MEISNGQSDFSQGVQSNETSKVFSGSQFSELPLDPHLIETLHTKLGVTKLTVPQRLAIPHILQHKDVLIKSPTGTGKTLAYAVPIVQSLLAAKSKVHTRTHTDTHAHTRPTIHARTLIPTHFTRMHTNALTSVHFDRFNVQMA